MQIAAQILPENAASGKPEPTAPKRDASSTSIEQLFSIVLSGYGGPAGATDAKIMNTLLAPEAAGASHAAEVASQGRSAETEQDRPTRSGERQSESARERVPSRGDHGPKSAAEMRDRGWRTSERGDARGGAAEASADKSPVKVGSVERAGAAPMSNNSNQSSAATSSGAQAAPATFDQSAGARAISGASAAPVSVLASLESANRSLLAANGPKADSPVSLSPVRGVQATNGGGRTPESVVKQKQQAQRAAPQPGAEAALRAQASRGLALALRSGNGSATIRLDPQHMGSLRVDVTVRGGAVEAVFRPTTVEAQRLLEHDHRALEQALGARGLRVDRIEIQPAEEGSSGRHAASNGQHADRATEGHDAAGEGGARGSPHGEPGREGGAGGAPSNAAGGDRPDLDGSAAEHAEMDPRPAEIGRGNGIIDTIA